jgi:hypothetical protein
MRTAFLIVTAFVLLGCAGTGNKVTASADLTPAQRATIEAAIRVRLKDPESARFGEFKAGRAEDGMTVCGQVNGKNSYGGYGGMSTFFGSLRGATFTEIEMDEPGGSRWGSNKCAQVGLGSWIY